MTTQSIYLTRFGRFASCDYATYKRIKRIQHLLQFARVQARRWQRAQRRQPRNRYFAHRDTFQGFGQLLTTVTCRIVTQEMICKLFWTIHQPADATPGGAPDGASLIPTQLLETFNADYLRARYPAATPSDALPLAITVQELTHLEVEIEAWYQNHWLKW